MTSKSPVRSCDDVDSTALSYAEIKALCAGNPQIKEKMDLDVEVAKLKLLKSDHLSQRYAMEDRLIGFFPKEISRVQALIDATQADIDLATQSATVTGAFAGMEILGKQHIDKEEAGKAIVNACATIADLSEHPIGSYRGFQMSLCVESFGQTFAMMLKGKRQHGVTLGTDPRGNILRIDNALAGLSDHLLLAQAELENVYHQQEVTQQEIEKPFPLEAQFQEKSNRLAELDLLLNMGEPSCEATCLNEQGEDAQETDHPMNHEKPSVLAKLQKEDDGHVLRFPSPKPRNLQEVR